MVQRPMPLQISWSSPLGFFHLCISLYKRFLNRYVQSPGSFLQHILRMPFERPLVLKELTYLLICLFSLHVQSCSFVLSSGGSIGELKHKVKNRWSVICYYHNHPYCFLRLSRAICLL